MTDDFEFREESYHRLRFLLRSNLVRERIAKQSSIYSVSSALILRRPFPVIFRLDASTTFRLEIPVISQDQRNPIRQSLTGSTVGERQRPVVSTMDVVSHDQCMYIYSNIPACSCLTTGAVANMEKEKLERKKRQKEAARIRRQCKPKPDAFTKFNAQSSKFFALPPEIRNEIHRLTFLSLTDDEDGVLYVYDDEQEKTGDPGVPDVTLKTFDKRPVKILPILQTCKQIHHEAKQVFWSSMLIACTYPNELLAFIQAKQLPHRRHKKSLPKMFPIDRVYHLDFVVSEYQNSAADVLEALWALARVAPSSLEPDLWIERAPRFCKEVFRGEEADLLAIYRQIKEYQAWRVQEGLPLDVDRFNFRAWIRPRLRKTSSHSSNCCQSTVSSTCTCLALNYPLTSLSKFQILLNKRSEPVCRALHLGSLVFLTVLWTMPQCMKLLSVVYSDLCDTFLPFHTIPTTVLDGGESSSSSCILESQSPCLQRKTASIVAIIGALNGDCVWKLSQRKAPAESWASVVASRLNRIVDVGTKAISAQLTPFAKFMEPEFAFGGSIKRPLSSSLLGRLTVGIGSNDVALDEATFETMIDKMSNANSRSHVFPDSGHACHFQYPDEFVRLATEFPDGPAVTVGSKDRRRSYLIVYVQGA
ncbi:hypothetical protein KCU69_g73, partial [Aureobasidium melanogenum]